MITRVHSKKAGRVEINLSYIKLLPDGVAGNSDYLCGYSGFKAHPESRPDAGHQVGQ